MSFSLASLPLALATASVIPRASARDLAHCSQQCDHLSYCDDYENKCKPCSDICSSGELSDCSTSCPHYILHLYSAQKLQPSQLNVLTIMVTLTALMTCVVMVLLVILMMMKMKKRRRLGKKINPSVVFTVDQEKIDMSDTKMKPLSVKELRKREKQDSLSTMVTQISNESSNHSENFTSDALRNSRNSGSLNSRTKRLPSEDYVPNFGRFNPGLDPTAEMSPREHDSNTSRRYCEVV